MVKEVKEICFVFKIDICVWFMCMCCQTCQMGRAIQQKLLLYLYPVKTSSPPPPSLIDSSARGQFKKGSWTKLRYSILFIINWHETRFNLWWKKWTKKNQKPTVFIRKQSMYKNPTAEPRSSTDRCGKDQVRSSVWLPLISSSSLWVSWPAGGTGYRSCCPHSPLQRERPHWEAAWSSLFQLQDHPERQNGCTWKTIFPHWKWQKLKENE